MTAVIVLLSVAAYIAVGVWFAEPICQRIYDNAPLAPFDKAKKEIDGTVGAAIAIVLVWPVAAPIALMVMRIRDRAVAREHERVS